MPTCPNCGSYIPLGNHSCSCGTTIRYDDDDEDYEEQSRRASHAEALIWLKKQAEAKRRSENPYDNDLLNELHHEGAPSKMLDKMSEGLWLLNNNYGLEWDDYEFLGPLLIFILKKHHDYFDVKIRAKYNLESIYNEVVLLEDTVIPDFTRLYSNDQFKKIVREMEEKTDSKFHFCRVVIIGYEFMVSAVFDDRGYIVDFENMRLVE